MSGLISSYFGILRRQDTYFQININALALGCFLREVDAKGELARQMLRDAEARAVSSSEPLPSLTSTPNLRLVKTDTAQPVSPDVSSSETSPPSSPSVLGVDDLEDLLDGVPSCELLD